MAHRERLLAVLLAADCPIFTCRLFHLKFFTHFSD
jgi:hypothetical protein